MVVRSIIGRSWGQGPQHSKTTQSIFAHFPGLKVVLPSDPQDGYSLLRSAIQDDDPVIFLEHRWLYDTVGEVDEDHHTTHCRHAYTSHGFGEILMRH